MGTKFGVLANVLLETVPLETPLKVQGVNDYLEMIYPGLGSRIRMQDDSMLDDSKDGSLGQQSTPTMSNLNGISTIRIGNARKSSFFPSFSESDDIPLEKKYKFDTETTPSSMTSTLDTSNISATRDKFSKCMKTFTYVFDQVFDLNIHLDEKIRNLEKKSSIEVKALERCNAQLNKKMEQVNKEMKEELELMEKDYYLKVLEIKKESEENVLKKTQESEKLFRRQLQLANDKHGREMDLLKAKYDKKIADLETERKKFFMENYHLIEKKDEECARAIREERLALKEEYRALIEDAKGKKYCIACGIGKPLDLFYVCDMNCQKNYW